MPKWKRLLLTGTELRILRGMVATALPLIVINAAHTVMQFLDALMVSRLGPEALAAVMPASFAIFLLVSPFWGLLTAVNTFSSQSIGQGRPQDCGRYVAQAMWLALGVGVLVLPLSLHAAPLFAVLGHAPEVQRLEVAYFNAGVWQVGPVILTIVFSNFFTAIHRTAYLMIAAVGANLINLAANYVLIFGHLGFPRLGVAGAAWGTVIALGCQALFLAGVTLSAQFRAAYGTWHLRPSGEKMRQLLRIGLPAGLHTWLDLIMWAVVLMWLAGKFGAAQLAATTVAVRYLHLSFMPALGLGATLTAFIGRSIGEGRIDRAEQEALAVFKVNFFYMGACGILFMLLREPLVALFSEDPETLRVGAVMLIWAGIYQLFDAANLTYSHALRGAGDNLWQAKLVLVSAPLILVGGGVVAAYGWPQFGATGPWAVSTLYVVLLGIVFPLRWRFGPWRRIDIFQRADPSPTQQPS